jgi:hypothetical protein
MPALETCRRLLRAAIVLLLISAQLWKSVGY